MTERPNKKLIEEWKADSYSSFLEKERLETLSELEAHVKAMRVTLVSTDEHTHLEAYIQNTVNYLREVDTEIFRMCTVGQEVEPQ